MSAPSDPTPAPNAGQAAFEDLGTDFEVLEDPGKPAAPAAAPVPSGPIQPLRSSTALNSLGLALALGGLLGPWSSAGGNLLHGALEAWCAWHLLVNGLAAVQPAWKLSSPILSGLLAVYGLLRLVTLKSTGMHDLLGWTPGTFLAAIGALFTLLGGALALAAPMLGKGKDGKLPPLPPQPERDQQFSQSLLCYLAVFFGLYMPWGGSGERGVSSGLGALTVVCVMLSAWACWAGLWRLWTAPLVTGGRLGMILFLAPMEALLMGVFGLARRMADPTLPPDSWNQSLKAWPPAGIPEPFLVYGAGPILVFGASAFALYLLFHGVRKGLKMNEQRKTDEMAARKAQREARKAAEAKP